MKKRFILLSLTGLLALASCNQQKDTTKRSDYPSTTNKTLLKLDDVSNGTLLREVRSDETDYVTVKVANDYKNTLFYLTTSLDETFESHGTLNKSVNFSPLTFTTNITDAEKSALSGYVYSETGIYSKDVSFDINKDITSWISNVDVKAYAEDYEKNKTSYSISVIYVPALVTHYATTYTSLECYVMFPLYYQVYKDGAKDNVFSKATDLTDQLEFDNNVLKSQTTEVSA